MMVLVTYDVNTEDHEGRTRLRWVAKVCQNFGQRVQKSVFECVVDPAQWATLQNKLTSIINNERDSLRFYFLGSNWRGRVEHVGAKPSYDPQGPLVI